MALAWDGDDEVVVIEAQALTESDEDEDDETAADRRRGRRGAAAAAGAASPEPPPGPSSRGRRPSSPPVARRARSAAGRWTPAGTCAPGPTATAAEAAGRERTGRAGSTWARALDLLRDGEIEVEGRLVDASNATLFCELRGDGVEARCVYKPVAGERPLWDFPDGTLAGREVASYAVSAGDRVGRRPADRAARRAVRPGHVPALGRHRPDAVDLVDVLAPAALPAGWLHVLDALGADGEPVVLGHADDARLRRMAVLDVVLNNADRKGGHVLPGPDGRVRGVDHGVTFHAEPKLRTVLWGWAGDAAHRRGAAGPRGAAGRSSTGDLGSRAGRAARAGRGAGLPPPGRAAAAPRAACPTRPTGWPAIPWPPF